MSQEIVYTSAPQGLKPGSRGFCTVIATQGMARNLAERLESLSGYRHAFAVHDENSHLNPVNYSHLKVTVGGQEYSVLSRICDAGQDYTGRTNKLAHHVALTRSERPPAGPAYQLQKPGFCVEEWDSQTRYTEMNCHHLSSDHPPLTQCTSWSRWCDAGWAGVLAQSALEGKNQTQTIIFPVEAGSSMLALVAEALQLLPEKKRWDVTFSTYFTKLPAGVDCQWRFVLDGTPEADAARRNPRMHLIDLCADLGTAPEGPLVEAARTGHLPQQQKIEPVVSFREAPLIPPQEAVQHDSTAEFPDIPESTPPVPPPLEKTRRTPGPPPLEKHFRKPKKNSRKLLMGAAVILLLLLSAGIGYLMMPGQNNVSKKVAKTQTPPPRKKNKEDLEKIQQARVKQAQKSAPPLTPNEDPEELVSVTQTKMTPEPKPKKKKTPPKKRPLDDVRIKHHGVLPLPSLAKNIGANNQSELTKIYVEDVKKCELSILGSEIVLGNGSHFLVKPVSDKPNQWAVIKKIKNGFGESVVGKFQLVENSLTFGWDEKPPELGYSLKYCLLKITVDSETVYCQLSKPVITKPIQLSFASPRKLTEVQFPSEAGPLPPIGNIQLDLFAKGLSKERLKGFSKFKIPTQNTIKHNSEYRISIFNPISEDDTEKLLDLIISFKRLERSVESGITIEAEAIGKKLKGMEKIPWNAKTSIPDINNNLKKECKSLINKTKSDLSNHEKKIIEQENIVKAIKENLKNIKADPNLPKGNAQQNQRVQYLLKHYKIPSIQAGEEFLKNQASILTNMNMTKMRLQDKISFFSNNELLCNKVLELFDQLERQVTIDYELFIRIKDKKVVIVTTSPSSHQH
ncbi:hypothetical protein FYZ48_23050 [Gimesia chilikensis]|uniref:GAP1-N2 domain-containing protein n=1 Tax=Gimesia chilikensis TaxID=2605989 RepID=UPI0011F04AFB|nr:hypothetical protein [Gimesia chilikensis]KAA0133693.1 hypothetical protein FYZ48_23050 [Gimesia chilikensis]